MTTTPPETPAVSLDDLTPELLTSYTKGKIRADDPRAPILLGGAVAAIRNYCHWHVSPSREETLTMDGHGGRIQRLPSFHVTDVQEVKDAGVLLEYRTGYRWSESGMLSRTHGEWSNEFRDVEITFTHGHASTPELVSVALAVVSRALASPMGATREQAGQMAVTWASTSPGVSGGMALLANELAILGNYRIP